MSSSAEPKQDRSRATRQKLLEAAVECLAQEGWQASTVGVIATRAGISRGAAQHHFPTREDLIIAALDYMFEQRSALMEQASQGEGYAAGSGIPGGGSGAPHGGAARVEAVVELLMEMYMGELFRAALQVWTAAAADDALRSRILPLERRFARDVHAMTVRLLQVDDSDPNVRALIQATLDLARGLALADILSDDSRRRRHVVRAWTAQLAAGLGRD